VIDPFADYSFLTCSECGIRWGMPQHFVNTRRENRDERGRSKNFYCPNGHSQIFKETEADKLRRERDLLKQQIARVEDERTAAWRAEEVATLARRKAEAQLKRTMSRAGAGVCPCCNRTFQQLTRHMQSKHPEIVPLDGISGVRCG
jgi:hypothetical protein